MSFAWLGCTPALQPSASQCDPLCTTGFHCADGTCVADASPDLSMPDLAGCIPPCAGDKPYCSAQNVCVACLADDQCPAERVCVSGQCVTGCNTDDDCRRKTGGMKSCCGGGCIDTNSDAANCGACGKVCAAAHAQAACVGGACAPGKCDFGWGDCNGDPSDGCETNVHVDVNNCTACGMKCSFPNGLSACSNGCYLGACNYGWDDCNNDPADGCEQNVTSDMKNCGACGNPCTNKSHAKNTCVNSSCIITSCDQGYSDCNLSDKDGCEVATGTDVNNCGRCGNSCPQGLVCVNSACTCPQCNIPGAKTKCVNNTCVFDSCLPGFGDCDNNQANGCEVNFNTDAKNCGGCGMACPLDAPNCTTGMCSAGFTHHDGLGHTWIDQVPTGTLTQSQALRACQEYVKQGLMGGDVCNPNGCGCGGQDLCVYNQNANPRHTWFYNMGNMGGEVTNNCCGCAFTRWD